MDRIFIFSNFKGHIIDIKDIYRMAGAVYSTNKGVFHYKPEHNSLNIKCSINTRLDIDLFN
jgi:hypothetical protein